MKGIHWRWVPAIIHTLLGDVALWRCPTPLLRIGFSLRDLIRARPHGLPGILTYRQKHVPLQREQLLVGLQAQDAFASVGETLSMVSRALLRLALCQ